METFNNGLVYKKAIILGNGFDIANGFKTRYSDFIKSQLFSDLLSTDNKLAIHIKNKFDEAKWVDIEIEIGLYSSQIEKKSLEKDFDVNTTRFKAEYNDLTRALYLYINGIRSGKSNPKMEKLAKERWFNPLFGKKQEKALIVSFNYLCWDNIFLLENLFKERFVGDCPQFPHGRTLLLENMEPNIVLGVDEKSIHSERHPFIVKAFNKNCNSSIFFKNIGNAEHYIIFGCSIGDTDQRYFKPIFSKAQNKRFEIYDYDDASLVNVKSNIAKLCNYSEFEAANEINFISSAQYSI